MRTYDEAEAAELNAQPWQTALLELNPPYVYWGPNEDYMWKEGSGWESQQLFASWAEFGPWGLDELNECVNFYFSVHRDQKECETCGGNGYHPDAQRVVNTFYRHQCSSVGAPEHEAWSDKITQDEVQALVDANRLHDFTHKWVGMAGEGWVKKIPEVIPTADEVNAWQRGRGVGHDAINRCILIEARLKRLGLPKTCPTCDGNGYVYTAPDAHVSLTLWWLHPRKGCSRGIEITRIGQSDLPAIFVFLGAAAARNASRFSKIPVVSEN
jgi:hypothetical protein